MQTKQLGNSDLKLSRIGLGTWAMGGSGWRYAWGAQDDSDSIKTIHHALDLGINWIDTAPVYGLGHAETIVGKALHGMQQPPIIATKCGRIWETPMTLGGNLKKESIKKEAEASLKRLGIETIDLYQIHWPKPDEDIEEGWSAISALIKEGKVRYGGVSNFNVSQLERIRKIHPVASLQPPYSMLIRDIESQILPFCAANGIGVIGYSPMYKGLLSGKFSVERVACLPVDDHRREDSHFLEPELTINLRLISKLRDIAESCGFTVAQLAIAWTLRRAEITAAIAGGRKPDQVDEIIRAGSWQLPPPISEKIDMLLKAREVELNVFS